jgi:hypothetical protein
MQVCSKLLTPDNIAREHASSRQWHATNSQQKKRTLDMKRIDTLVKHCGLK